MTTLLGTWKPFLSNSLLTSLFGKGCPLEAEYGGFFEEAEEKYWKEGVSVEGKQEEVYVVRAKAKTRVEGMTKAH